MRAPLARLAQATVAGLPARDLVAASVAVAEADVPNAVLTVAFAWLAQTADAPPGVAVCVSALLSVLLASLEPGGAGLEALRVTLPLTVGLALAYVASDDATHSWGEGDGNEHFCKPLPWDEVKVSDPRDAAWQAELERRLIERTRRNHRLLDAVIARTRGISEARGAALKAHCRDTDALTLTVDDWEQCDGIGEALAQRIHAGLRQVAGEESSR